MEDPFVVPAIGTAIGFPFAWGISFLTRNDQNAIPWAWGVNGCFSVLAPISATIFSVQVGYNALFLIAGFAYLITLVAVLTVKKFSSSPS